MNLFEELKTTEDFNNFLFELILEAQDKGFTFTAYNPALDEFEEIEDICTLEEVTGIIKFT